MNHDDDDDHHQSSSSSTPKKPSPSPTSESEIAALSTAQAFLTRRNEQIPLSLGKASLRLRLEAYYSLISPDTLSNRTEWLRKYDQIYEKYGGTHPGERKLATKLAKKYGTAVRLLLAASVGNDDNKGAANHDPAVRDESWYRLRPEETGSGVVDFVSSEFDPVEALTRASTADVSRANDWMDGWDGATILDNLEKCRSLLPENDPLHRESHLQAKLRKASSATKKLGTAELSFSKSGGMSVINAAAFQKRPRNSNKLLHPFEAIASHLDSGPHSLLFRCREERKRVKIVVRYVNMVRGTLSGTLIAFDKHMNMILRDAEEVYSPRLVDEQNEWSNLEVEIERRRRIRDGGEESSSSLAPPLFDTPGQQEQEQEQQHEHKELEPGTWNVRRRQMKQLMVRGDMVVSIYEADKENRKASRSRYRKRKRAEAKSL